MNTFTPFFIVSAEIAGLSDEQNAARSETVAHCLRQLGYATADVRGCYKDKTERAFLVLNERPDLDLCERDVLRLARVFGQESVLAVDANRRACLIYCSDGSFESIGQWRGASEGVAKTRDAWTERAGQFYIVE